MSSSKLRCIVSSCVPSAAALEAGSPPRHGLLHARQHALWRRLGMAVVQAMARHRLARVPYVGVPHAVVQARAQRRQQGGGDAWVFDAQDIFLDMARFQAGGGGVWGA